MYHIMAFGVTRSELQQWKEDVAKEEIAFLTHYWEDKRFPGCSTVTKVGCANIEKLAEWGKQYNLLPEWIDLHDSYPHFDLFGDTQLTILQQEQQFDHIQRFSLQK